MRKARRNSGQTPTAKGPTRIGKWVLEVGANGHGFATNMVSAETFETLDGEKFYPGIGGHWPNISASARKRLRGMIRTIKRNPLSRKRGLTRKLARAVMVARRSSKAHKLRRKLRKRLGFKFRKDSRYRPGFVRHAALLPKRRRKL